MDPNGSERLQIQSLQIHLSKRPGLQTTMRATRPQTRRKQSERLSALIRLERGAQVDKERK